MKRYIIDSQTLQTGDFDFTINVGMELFEAMETDDIQDAEFEIRVIGNRLASNKMDIELNGEGKITTICDRCLDSVTLPEEVAGAITIYFGDEVKPFDGYTATIRKGDTFSIAQFVYDCIMLDLPVIRAHAPEECNPEMIARIKGEL